MKEAVVADENAVLYDTQDGVATLTLNRPERLNAWNGAMGTQYFDALDKAAADPDVKVIVITGAGRGFCAGADMDVLQGIGAAGGQTADRTRQEPATYALKIPKPIIAAINGACAGLGLVHATMCDIRFAAEGAKFTTAFVRRGLIAEHGLSWTLPRLVGQGVALDLLCSGRVFVAEEAKELGLVNKVFAPESLMDETLAYAKDLAQNCSPASMATIKKQVYRHIDADLDSALAESNEWMGETLRAPDFKEGVASFVEKRLPNFSPLSATVE
jgi:enoyl-CoA hydratase/carnithine racemase